MINRVKEAYWQCTAFKVASLRFSELLSITISVSLINLSVVEPARSQNYNFQTADGIKESTTFYKAKAAKGLVLLLPMLGRTSSDYAPLVKPLLDCRLSVLSVDFRGHGASIESKKGRVDFRNFKDSDWHKLPADMELLLKSLPKTIWTSGQPIYIVGASIGANTAAITAANSPVVKAIILLSPGLDYHGLCPEDAVAQFKGPVLIVASSEDAYAYSSSRQLAAINTKRIRFQSFNNSGHGTQMFGSQAKLAETLASWLNSLVQK
ncbi:MAG: alpha/beta fold hydrolase [Candidatus Obscuribacterales bacterium]|nr:alpha/beta fold hydrolase [Candidatus Obscuribacterales bacterium]